MTGYFKTPNGNVTKNVKSHPVGQFSPSTLGQQVHTTAPPCRTGAERAGRLTANTMAVTVMS